MPRKPCRRCDETGYLACPHCDGEGYVKDHGGLFNAASSRPKRCPRCKGSGEITCPKCGGLGYVDYADDTEERARQ